MVVAWNVRRKVGQRGREQEVVDSVRVPGLGRLIYHNVDLDFPAYGESDNWAIVKE